MRNILVVFLIAAVVVFAEDGGYSGGGGGGVSSAQLAAETSAREAADATKVDNNSGTATNLQVVSQFVVTGVVVNTSCTISGTDAGGYSGVYSYAGTDEYYESYYTNTVGRFLLYDIDLSYFGSWCLGTSLINFEFVYDASSDWYSPLGWEVVDISMDGTPSHAITGAVQIFYMKTNRNDCAVGELYTVGTNEVVCIRKN